MKIIQGNSLDIKTNQHNFNKGVHFVYFLMDNNDVVYVGMSSTIGSRLKLHKQTDKIFGKYIAIECPDKSVQKRLEEFLIASMRPKYNKTPGNCTRKISIEDVYHLNKLIYDRLL